MYLSPTSLHSLTTSLPHHLTPSPPHSLTTSLPHHLTPSPPHSFTTSLPHTLTGQPLGEVEVCLADVVYSPELHGFSVVMGDGKAVFISAKSAKYEPQVDKISPFLCVDWMLARQSACLQPHSRPSGKPGNEEQPFFRCRTNQMSFRSIVSLNLQGGTHVFHKCIRYKVRLCI